MERGTIQLPIFCGENILIIFLLNVDVPVYLVSAVNPIPNPKYCGELLIFQVPPSNDPNPFALLKTYNFDENFIQVAPALRRITAKNFIAFLENIISILQRIIYNNENPWLVTSTTSTPDSQSRPYYVNLNTKQTFWNLEGQDPRIYPWTVHMDPHGRPYYVNRLMNETSWFIPSTLSLSEEVSEEGKQQKQEPYMNTVLKQIIKCLSDINLDPQPTRLTILRLIREEKKRYNEEMIRNKKITRVFVIVGHSMCGRRKFEIKDPRTCLMTLSKLNDSFTSSQLGLSIFFSNILKTLKNPNPDIRSFMDIAKLNREKKFEFASKDQKDSIRVRCNHGNSKFTVTDQIFFGSTIEKYFDTEGVFMLTREDMSPQDISMEMLTPCDTKHLYDETTEFQKRIIDIESQSPESQSPESSFHDLKKQFEESELKNLELEWRNLQIQRMMFCRSLNYSDNIRQMDVESESLCRGIDVRELQHYYDCIINWEKNHKTSAYDYFEDKEGGIIEFMDEYSISKEKKIEGIIMLLSNIRKQQVEYNMAKRKKEQLNDIAKETDFQKISSSYKSKSGYEILQKINTDYPEENKLIIFHGCRNIQDSEEKPQHSENEEGVTLEEGGAKYNYKNNRKKISKKNKKIKKQNKKISKKKKHSIRVKTSYKK
jgi:hypothetical protein